MKLTLVLVSIAFWRFSSATEHPQTNLRRLTGRPTEEELDSFKKGSILKKDANVEIEEISDGCFDVGPDEATVSICIGDMKSVDLNAKFIVDGKHISVDPSVYSLETGDSYILAGVKADGSILSVIEKVKSNGKAKITEEIKPGVYGRFSSDDYDKAALSKYKYGDVMTPQDRLLNEHLTSKERRDLVATGKYLEVSMIFIVEETACTKFGGVANAPNTMQLILALLNDDYRLAGIQINPTIEMRCAGGDTEPYSTMVSSSRSVCGGGKNVLDAFRAAGLVDRTTYGLAHMFFDKQFGGSGVIGCAYIGALCDLEYGAGVTNVYFTNSINLMSLVAVHELGHGFNAGHDTSITENIMYPYIGSDISTWTLASAQTMNSFVDNFHGSSCTAVSQTGEGVCSSSSDCEDMTGDYIMPACVGGACRPEAPQCAAAQGECFPDNRCADWTGCNGAGGSCCCCSSLTCQKDGGRTGTCVA